MAVKASDQITMTDLTDVKSVCRYYLLQSSTLAVPAKPTTNPPSSSWTKTEPSYTAGSTNSLYFTDLTVFSNDTFSYSDVSKSSSYEAAKTAYNKAVEAAKTATNFIDFTEANGLQVGNKQSGLWVGHRAQLKSGVFQIVSETGSRIAQFAATLIELGRNQADAVILLCGGKGKISTDTNGIKIGDGWVNIESNGGIDSIIEEEVSGGLVKPGTIAYVDFGKIGLTAKNRRGTGQVKVTAFASGGSNLGGDPDTATIESSLATGDVTKTSTLKVSPTSIDLQSDAVNIEAESVSVNGIDILTLLKWKLHGTFTGSDEQSLPKQFDELCVIVNLTKSSGDSLGKYTFNIPYMELRDSYYEYKNGGGIYYNAAHHHTIITVSINKTNIKLDDAKTSSGSTVVNCLNYTSYSVYYR